MLNDAEQKLQRSSKDSVLLCRDPGPRTQDPGSLVWTSRVLGKQSVKHFASENLFEMKT